jgi:hypothetical protein
VKSAFDSRIGIDTSSMPARSRAINAQAMLNGLAYNDLTTLIC